MTPAELRQAVAAAILDAFYSGGSPTDAALRVVREALREPSGEMINAGAQDTNAAMGDGTREAGHVWRAVLAASPLREE